MNKIDAMLQHNFPCVPIPMHSNVERPAKYGERLLIGSNGIFLEVSRAWCYLVRRIAEYSVSTPIPYGRGSQTTEFYSGAIPGDMLDEFVEMARTACPLETAAFISWNDTTGEYKLHRAQLKIQLTDYLEYAPPQLARNEHLIIDLHSHGNDDAFFSPKDDCDDETYVKVALVYGNCDRGTPTLVGRLCVKGIFENLTRDSLCH